jgi:predicted anti-sigma-YlaC factor YlaD
MSCENHRENISALLDGQTDSAVSSAVKEHLKVCSDCRSFYESVKMIETAFENAAPSPADEREIWLAVSETKKSGRAKTLKIIFSAAAAVVIGMAALLTLENRKSTPQAPDNAELTRAAELTVSMLFCQNQRADADALEARSAEMAARQLIHF